MRDGPATAAWWFAVVEGVKSLWYRSLRKWHLVEPVFAGAGPAPTIERGSAQVEQPARQRPAEPARPVLGDPILQALRQRAARELFEWLGLDQIPKGYWALLDRLGDPARALVSFISSSRFDPTLVRRREPAELAAFRNFVRFACQVEESTDRVSQRQRDVLDRYAYYGEHDVVRDLLDLFVTLNEAVALFERSPEPRFAAFAMHIRGVSALRERATRADGNEAAAALAISRQYARLMWRYRNATDRKERIEALAREHWETLSLQDQAIWTSLLADLAETRRALMAEASGDARARLEDCERRVERLDVLCDELEVWVRNAAAANERRHRAWQARREEEARRKRESAGTRPDLAGREAASLSRDELLSIFDFPPGSSPELGALRRAFIGKASETHPVQGQPDYRERNDRYRILKDAYERLKIALG